MIASLSGIITHIDAPKIILEVNSVGYEVYLTVPHIQGLSENSPLSLPIYTIVREQSLDLYGFPSHSDKKLFELLLSVNGIGPKAALNILSVATRETLITAISSQDSSVLTKVSGIGKKNAEKILLELENKITRDLGDSTPQGNQDDLEVMEALEALGYSLRNIQQAMRESDLSDMETKSKIRYLIQTLSK